MSATDMQLPVEIIAPATRPGPIRCSSPAWRWHCHADPLLFITWEAVPATLQTQLQHLGTLPCHRNGVPGPWCSACAFGTSTTEGGL